MSEGSGCGQLLVRARFPFQQTNEDELSFSKGDLIIVTRQEEGGWWEGTLKDKTGWFPSNYVRELKGNGGLNYYCFRCCAPLRRNNSLLLWSQRTVWYLSAHGPHVKMFDFTYSHLQACTIWAINIIWQFQVLKCSKINIGIEKKNTLLISI